MSAELEPRRALSQSGTEKIVSLRGKGLSNEMIAKEFNVDVWVIDLILQLEW
jgi:hypothetical protein